MKNNKEKKLIIFYKVISLSVVIILMGYIFHLSAETAEISSETSGRLVSFLERLLERDISSDLVRTLAHFTEYCAFGFFVHNSFYSFKNRSCTTACICCSFVYAASDEIHQIFVPGRAFQISDLAVDLSGIVLGTFLFLLLIKIFDYFKKTNSSKKRYDKV